MGGIRKLVRCTKHGKPVFEDEYCGFFKYNDVSEKYIELVKNSKNPMAQAFTPPKRCDNCKHSN